MQNSEQCYALCTMLRYAMLCDAITENFSMGSFSEDEPEGDYTDALKALASMSVLTDLWNSYNQVTATTM
jgi:hypothetical protein